MICSYIALLLQNTQGRGPRNIEADICDVCNTAAPADLAALARHGKGVTCDPSCVEHEEGDSLYCNALGLGQVCRFCGICEDCKPCPPDWTALPTATPRASSIEFDNECAKCQGNLTDANIAALAERLSGVLCDASCFMGDTLYCNIFGLGQICRLCGSCEGCKPCSEETFFGISDAPSPSPMTEVKCPEEVPLTLECGLEQEGLSCGYDCVCCDGTTERNELCEPLDGSASNVCGFSTFYNCQERVWVTLSVDFTLCPEPTSGGPTHPKTRDTPSPSAILTSTPPPSIVFTGSPVSQRLPDGGSDGERGCPVNPPQMERCSRDQEGIECKYGCVCCDASTEFDENCEPTEAFEGDRCAFTNFFWCERGQWIWAVSDPYCPSWYSSIP